MSLLAQQLDLLAGQYPGATVLRLPDNSHLVTVPDVKLPPGWSKQSVTIKFLAPVGYPMARPDCFWTDHDLRLGPGNLPRSTGPNPIPNVPGQHLWFSWHLSSWNPNSDNFLTYLNVIRKRLAELV
jgi:hypothetical protein